MTQRNRHTNGAVAAEVHTQEPVPPVALVGSVQGPQFAPEQIKQFVALLEVPFDPIVIEWRVTNTSKGKVNGSLRGQVIPYADQRAYTDRLNALFSPAGWTRKYSVHTSANFQRDRDQKTTAKVFVTCDLTIFGIGSHSATGEEWADNENAGTAAEAQAFKRSCACFGLGRYLYYFTGTWVDLDERKRPKSTPKLASWATPEGWRQGLRPHREGCRLSSMGAEGLPRIGNKNRQEADVRTGSHPELIRHIEAMAQPLGRNLYRGLLKTVGRAWNPDDIKDGATLQRLLAHMQAADRGLKRLNAALDKTGSEPLAVILRSFNVATLERVNNLEILEKIVLALEVKAGSGA